MSLVTKTIGQVARELGVSTHTLRYYEKINLLPQAPKDARGNRYYDLSRIEQLRFIRRAQRMHFSLDEIKQLLLLDASTAVPKPEVQAMVNGKLQQIDENLAELLALKDELSMMLSRCQSSQTNEKCPILEKMKSEERN